MSVALKSFFLNDWGVKKKKTWLEAKKETSENWVNVEATSSGFLAVEGIESEI